MLNLGLIFSNLFILTENWNTWYIGGAVSESRLWFLKFRPRNPFLGKFAPEKLKLFVLPENWHTWYLEDDVSYSNVSFLKLRPEIHFWANLGRKNQSFLFCLKIGRIGISRMVSLISTLVLWTSSQKSSFEQILAKKVKFVRLAWKVAHMVSQRCWFLFQRYFSEFPTKNPFLSKFSPKKNKAVRFAWKLAHMVSRGYWFLFRH